MSKPNKKSDGTVPNAVLSQLNEHTIGGFILFYFNSETGEAEQAMIFDTPAPLSSVTKSC
jgi:hypothetical protein